MKKLAIAVAVTTLLAQGCATMEQRPAPRVTFEGLDRQKTIDYILDRCLQGALGVVQDNDRQIRCTEGVPFGQQFGLALMLGANYQAVNATNNHQFTILEINGNTIVTPQRFVLVPATFGTPYVIVGDVAETVKWLTVLKNQLNKDENPTKEVSDELSFESWNSDRKTN